MTLSSKALGVALAMAATLCYAAMPVWARQAYAAGLTPLQLVLLRMAIATLILVVVVLGRHRRSTGRVGRRQASPLLVTALSYAAMSVSFFYACDGLDAGLANALFHVYPVFVILFSAAFHRTRPTLAAWGAALLVVVGSAVMVGSAPAAVSLPHVALSIVSAVFSAVYATALEDERLAHVDTFVMVLLMCVVTLVASGVAYLVMGGELFIPSTEALLYVALIAVFSTVAAHAMYVVATKILGAVPASILGCSECIATLAIGASVLGETVTLAAGVGCALVAVGGVLVCITPAGEEKQQG